MRVWLLLISGCLLRAQEFDVASIKPTAPLTGGAVRIFTGPPRGGPGSSDPAHITWNASLLRVLETAYDVKNYQINAPDWMSSNTYEFAVGVPEGATKEQVAVMWRTLLAARFGLKLRIEKKQFDVDELVVGPQGHKLIATTLPDAPAADPAKPPAPIVPPAPPKLDASGSIVAPTMTGAGLMMLMQSGPTGVKAIATGKAQTMASLVQMLGNQAGHPVVDKTGLTGKYDFSIEFTPTQGLLPGLRAGGPPASQPQNGPAPVAEVGVDLAGALQQQLGLRINRSKGMLDYLVVEKADKTPTEN